MSYVKMYFKNGVPSDEIIKSWQNESVGHVSELVILKGKDDKTILMDFGEVSFDFIEICKNFYKSFDEGIPEKITSNEDFYKSIYNRKINPTNNILISCFGYYSSESDFFIYCSDGNQSELSLSFSNNPKNKFMKMTTKQEYRFLQTFGFDREFIRFYFSDPRFEVVLDNTLSDDAFKELMK